MSEWQIIAEEAERAGVRVEMLTRKKGPQDLTPVRTLVAKRLRTELGLSYPAIGRALGGRHHTTIMSYFEVPLATPRERAQWLVYRGAGL